MDITLAKKINDDMSNDWVSVQATIDGVEMFIPIDPTNRHYVEIMKQVEAGTLTIAEADE